VWKKTISVVLSLAKAKYQALIEGTKEVVWLRKLLSEIKHIKPRPTLMFCDNSSNIKMAKVLYFMPGPNISSVIITLCKTRGYIEKLTYYTS
jgi:hypothetical protein